MRIPKRKAQQQIVELKTALNGFSHFAENPYARGTSSNRKVSMPFDSYAPGSRVAKALIDISPWPAALAIGHVCNLVRRYCSEYHVGFTDRVGWTQNTNPHQKYGVSSQHVKH